MKGLYLFSLSITIDVIYYKLRGRGSPTTFFRENNFFYQIRRFNSLAKMSVHKDTLDSLSVIHIANEFVKLQPERQNIFGTFSEQDL